MTETPEAKTILIIEDDVEIRNFASRVLELEGYHILQAEDTEGGMRLLRKGIISLVLLDLRLPGRDGWSVLGQVKDEPRLSVIPIIVFTASVGVSQRKRALKLGAVDYLVKPLSAAGLRKAIACALHQKR